MPRDQKRVTTPAAAVAAGADYLVIGRTITEADNPIEVVDSIVSSIS
ncbi:MAG: orotidine 5'-phosphate decarboxylase [Candidatus Dadabacteria bacterium]|nr:orotidine 5'-phosphate decarboxylase [Candidatus Dadabacteria bacterium]